MPQPVEDCRRRLMADPDFKPRKGSTKEEAAWAVCMSTVGKGKTMDDAYALIRKERKSYSIPASVKAEAKRGLAWRKEFGRGGTSVGLNTARTLTSSQSVGEAKIRHIAKYFPRHEVDKKGKGWSKGEKGYPSNGRIAWALWGGDAGKAWASEKVRVLNREKFYETFNNITSPTLRKRMLDKRLDLIDNEEHEYTVKNIDKIVEKATTAQEQLAQLRSRNEGPKRRQVVEIGARGGRIVGRDSRGKPIYEGQMTTQEPMSNSEVRERASQIKAFVEQTYLNTDAKKLRELLAVKEDLKTNGDTLMRHSQDGKFSKNRQRTHKNILRNYTQAIKDSRAKDKNPRMIMLAGLPGSGKSTAVKDYFQQVEGSDILLKDKNGDLFVVINADDIKAGLPEYQGGKGAMLVHEESSILSNQVGALALASGANVILDGTMANLDKAENRLSKYKKAGYGTEIIHIDVPAETSIERAANRFNQTGRFVAYEMIGEYEGKLNKTAEKLKGSVDSYTKIDNTGKTPLVVEQLGESQDNPAWEKIKPRRDDIVESIDFIGQALEQQEINAKKQELADLMGFVGGSFLYEDEITNIEERRREAEAIVADYESRPEVQERRRPRQTVSITRSRTIGLLKSIGAETLQLLSQITPEYVRMEEDDQDFGDGDRQVYIDALFEVLQSESTEKKK